MPPASEQSRSSPPPAWQIVLAFAAVYLVWGSTYLAIRFAVETLPPFLMAGARFLTAGTVMYLWFRARGEPAPTRANWSAALLVGGLLLLGGNGAVVWAEQDRISSGLAALLVATLPFWMVLLEWGMEGRRPRARVWIGLVMGFGGIGLLIGPGEILGDRRVDVLGASVLIAAAFVWALGSLLARRLDLPRSAFLATGMEMLAGGALLVLAGTLAGEWADLDPAAVSTRSLLSLLYLVVFGSGVGFTAYIWLLGQVDAARLSTYAYVNPVVAVFLGWALAGEPLSARTAVAAAIILGAVAFITSLPRKRPAEPLPGTGAPPVEGRRGGTDGVGQRPRARTRA